MNLDVVNNTNEQLSINELNVEVDESKPILFAHSVYMYN